ncbi:MAG: flavin reductase family protein [Porticoccaceae bacterium]|nr:flavin reductase family protein [Porticoccaceae bacterium]
MSITEQQRELRNAFGCFATGVTVITTRGADGSPVGMTANSFASVSLDPPLVLWSIARQSNCFDSFINASHFAIHVLTSDQQAVSNTFACKENDKFASTPWQRDGNGTPLLDHYAARMVCSMSNQHDGGDHVILVGKVEEFDYNNNAPLIFHSGVYKEISGNP